MNKIILAIIISIFLFIISTVAYCQEQKIQLYYGNGVGNEYHDAWDNLEVLIPRVEAKIKGTNLEGKIDYGVSHNPTESLLEDLLEASIQSLNLTATRFWRYLSGLDIVPDSFQEGYKDAVLLITRDMVSSNPFIAEHVRKYNKDLCSGDKLLVVAHSQGNFYVNIAYEGIYENLKESFGIVSVANPDYEVADGGPYTTIMEDQIIGIIPTSMPRLFSNFDSNVNFFDWSGHKFIDSYLATGHPAETKILNDIVATINGLEWPEEGSCSQTMLYIDYTPSDGEKVCILWDMENNAPVDFAFKNEGSKASFPCLASEISIWKSNFENFGTPALKITSEFREKEIDKTGCKNSFEQPGTCFIETMEYDCAKSINGYDINGFTNENATLTSFARSVLDTHSEMMWKMVMTAHEYYPFRYHSGPLNYHLRSLTNVGGDKGRPCAVTRDSEGSQENSSYDSPTCSEFISGSFLTYISKLNYTYVFRSPFSDGGEEIVELLSKNVYANENPNFSGSSCNISRVKEELKESSYKAGGIIGDMDSPYMVVFYSEKASKENSYNNVCGFTGAEFKPWAECGPYLPSCNKDDDTVFEPRVTLFENIKAFVQKSPDDPMDLNPFEISESTSLTDAMKELFDYGIALSGEQAPAPDFTLYFLR